MLRGGLNPAFFFPFLALCCLLLSVLDGKGHLDPSSLAFLGLFVHGKEPLSPLLAAS